MVDLLTGDPEQVMDPDPSDLGAIMAAKTIARGNPNDAAITDRVTSLLKGTEYSPIADIATSFRASRQLGAPTFGEIYNQIRGQRIKEAEDMQKLSLQSEEISRREDATRIGNIINMARLEAAKTTSFQKDFSYLTKQLGLPQDEAIKILKPGGADKGPKALSTGEAYNALVEYKTYIDAGQEPPPELVSRATAAAHILKQPRFVQTTQGLMEYTPGVPSGFPTPKGGLPSPQAPAAPGATGTPGLKLVVPKKTGERIGAGIKTVSEIADILEEAAKAGETITGVEGTAKKTLGPLARQAGIPISPRAERLQRSLNSLKALVSPAIMGETRLSNEERAKLDKLIGDVDPFMDDVALRDALANILDLLDRARLQ